MLVYYSTIASRLMNTCTSSPLVGQQVLALMLCAAFAAITIAPCNAELRTFSFCVSPCLAVTISFHKQICQS